MPRNLDPDAATPDLHWRPRQEQDVRLCRDIKKILRNDNMTIGDFLRPFLTKERERRSPSNPQTILTPEGITLSQAQREKLGLEPNEAHIFEQEVVCENCGQRHKAQVTCWGKPGEFHL